jgi:hypothetical protein
MPTEPATGGNIYSMIREAIRAVREGRDGETVVQTLSACAAALAVMGHPGDREEAASWEPLIRSVMSKRHLLPITKDGQLFLHDVDALEHPEPGWDPSYHAWLDLECNVWVATFMDGGKCPFGGDEDFGPERKQEIEVGKCLLVPRGEPEPAA